MELKVRSIEQKFFLFFFKEKGGKKQVELKKSSQAGQLLSTIPSSPAQGFLSLIHLND